MAHINTYINAVSKTGITIAVLLAFLLCATDSKASFDSSAYTTSNASIDSLKQLLTKPLPDTLRIDILNSLAVKLQYKQTQAGLAYAKEALELCNQMKDDNRKSVALNRLGSLYNFTGNYTQALSYNLQLLRLHDVLNKGIAYKAPVLNNIGTCYIRLKQYELARKYLLSVLNASGNDSSIHISVLRNVNINLGVIESIRNNFDTSLIYYKQALNLCERKEQAVLIYLNMGESYNNINRPQLALDCYNRALPLIKGNSQGLISYYMGMGELYLKQDSLIKAKDHFFKAKAIAETSGMNADMVDVYEYITMMYEKAGDFKNAYLYHKKHKALQDSILNEATSKKLAEIQEGYELEKRDNEILLLNKDKMIHEEQANKERILRYAFTGMIVFLITLSLILIRNVLHKQKVNRVLNTQKEQIEQQNMAIAEQKSEIEEKNRKLDNFNKELLKENIFARYEVLKSKVNPHFLFNSLSALGNMVLKDPEKSFDFLSRFAQLYRSIISTSDKSLITLEKEIELVKDYVSLQQIRFEENLNVSFDIRSNRKHLYVPPFALQIIVENVLKHNMITPEHPLHIHISVDNTKITVTNSVQRRKDVEESTGFGQQNLIERYRIITNHKPVFKQYNDVYVSSIPVIEKEEINV